MDRPYGRPPGRARVVTTCSPHGIAGHLPPQGGLGDGSAHGVLLGIAIVVLMPILAGVVWWVSLMYFGLMFVVLLVYCRNRAEMGFPIVVRPSFTMGGLGSGIAQKMAEACQIHKRSCQTEVARGD